MVDEPTLKSDSVGGVSRLSLMCFYKASDVEKLPTLSSRHSVHAEITLAANV